MRLRDALDRAGVKPGAIAVRFNDLDEPVVPDAPDFMKSLGVDHARDGEGMIAYQTNGEQLPLLIGFPLRLIVPGWYSTYWVKMLNDIEVLDKPDETFWMKTAYRVPDTPMRASSRTRRVQDGADQTHGAARLDHQPRAAATAMHIHIKLARKELAVVLNAASSDWPLPVLRGG